MSVKRVQTDLVKLGYGRYLGKYGIDGRLGGKTVNTVRIFQTDYNRKFKKKIYIDGLIGNQVRDAIKHYKKNVGKRGSKNFNIKEFHSKDGSGLLRGGLDNNLILKLEQLRYELGNKSIIVTSGYRSIKHNKAVGGVRNSYHVKGKASDIKVRGVLPSKVYSASLKIFDGVGKYNTFTHVDTRGYKARF